MNMKKLMAGVAAGALAVSTLAASAFAEAVPYPITQAAGDLYAASFTYDSGDIDIAKTLGDNATGKITVKVDTSASTDTAYDKSYAYAQVTDYTITLTYFSGTGDASEAKTLEVKKTVGANDYWGEWGSATAEFTYTVGNSASAQITKLDKESPIAVKVTATVQSTVDMKKDAESWAKVQISVGESTLKNEAPKFSADATKSALEAAPRFNVDLGKEFKPADLANFKTVSLVMELADEPYDDGKPAVFYVPVKMTGAADGSADKTVNAIFNGKTATVDIPTGFFYVSDRGYDTFGGKIEIDNAAAVLPAKNDKGEKTSIKTVTIMADFDEQQTQQPATSTSDTQVSEDDPTNTSASDTQAPASSDDNGNTNAGTGDDKNQPTGVALAVIPAIVAAAGVVIAKKRG